MLRTLTRTLFLIGISLLLFMQQSWAESGCFNVGVITKSTLDKKEKSSVAGDIKSLEVIYDYELSEITGTIIWNKVPTSKLITTVSIGETSQDPRCNDSYQTYLMTGWTKRFKADQENWYSGFDKTSIGNFKVLSSGKNTLNFVWKQSTQFSGFAMTQLCVAVFTNRIGTAYSNSINCIGNTNSLSCQGPGYIEAWNEIDFVQNFAFQRGREVDPYTCRFPLGQVPGT